MKNIIVKTMSILVIILFVFSSGIVTYASDINGVSISISGNDAAEKAGSIASNILGVIQVVATATAIGMLLLLGIKYVKAAPDEKAQVKESATIYIIGAVLIFAALGIANVVMNFANTAFNS